MFKLQNPKKKKAISSTHLEMVHEGFNRCRPISPYLIGSNQEILLKNKPILHNPPKAKCISKHIRSFLSPVRQRKVLLSRKNKCGYSCQPEAQVGQLIIKCAWGRRWGGRWGHYIRLSRRRIAIDLWNSLDPRFCTGWLGCGGGVWGKVNSFGGFNGAVRSYLPWWGREESRCGYRGYHGQSRRISGWKNTVRTRN